MVLSPAWGRRSLYVSCSWGSHFIFDMKVACGRILWWGLSDWRQHNSLWHSWPQLASLFQIREVQLQLQLYYFFTCFFTWLFGRLHTGNIRFLECYNVNMVLFNHLFLHHAVANLRGALGIRFPLSFKFLSFSYSFRQKVLPNNRLAPPHLGLAILGNPGSATGMFVLTISEQWKWILFILSCENYLNNHYH